MGIVVRLSVVSSLSNASIEAHAIASMLEDFMSPPTHPAATCRSLLHKTSGQSPGSCTIASYRPLFLLGRYTVFIHA